MIQGCRFQLRVGLGGAFALDMGAVLAVAEAQGARTPLLAEVLPAIEVVLIAAMRSPDDGEEGSA